MTVSYVVLTPPASEPIQLATAKAWLRVDFPDDDTLISQLITDARNHAEELTKRALATQTIQAIIEPLSVDIGALSGPVGAPGDTWQVMERPDIPLFGNALIRLKMPLSPVQSITTVEYQLTRMANPEWTLCPALDANGNPNYRLDTVADPAELNIFTVLAASRYRLTYQAGYTTLPQNLRRAMLSLIAFWYNNREGQAVPDEINSKITQKRIWEL